MAMTAGAAAAGAGLQVAGDLFSTIYAVENQKAIAAEQRKLNQALNREWMQTAKDLQTQALSANYNTLRSAGFTEADAALLSTGRAGGGSTLTWTPSGFKNYAPGAQLGGRYTAPTTSTYTQLASSAWQLGQKAKQKIQQIPVSRRGYYRLA